MTSHEHEQGPATAQIPVAEAITEQVPATVAEQTNTPEQRNLWRRRIGIGALIGAIGAASWFGITRDGGEPARADAGATMSEDDLRSIFEVGKGINCVETIEKAGVGEVLTRNGEEFVNITHIAAIDRVPNGRHGKVISSDAMGYKLTSKGNTNLLTEIQANLCRNPLQEQAFEYELGNLEINGKKVRNIVDGFMSEAPATTGEINDNAERYLLGLDGNISDDAELDKQVELAQNFATRAGKLGKVLERLHNLGIKKGTTVHNLHLADGGQAKDGQLPEVRTDRDYTDEFVTFAVTTKIDDCPEATFGVNPGDERPAILKDKCVDVKPPKPQPTPSPRPPKPTPEPKVLSCPQGRDDYLDDGVCNDSINSGPDAGGTPGPEGTKSQKPEPEPTETEHTRPTETPTPDPTTTPEPTPTTKPTSD